MGGEIWSNKRLEYPFVPAGGCDRFIWIISEASHEVKPIRLGTKWSIASLIDKITSWLASFSHWMGSIAGKNTELTDKLLGPYKTQRYQGRNWNFRSHNIVGIQVGARARDSKINWSESQRSLFSNFFIHSWAPPQNVLDTLIWVELCSPKFIYSSTKHDVTIFGDRVFRDIKLDEVIKVGPWSNKIYIFIRRGRDIRGEATWDHNKKAIFYKQIDVSQETNSDNTLILDSHPSGLWENKFLLLIISSVGYFVTAAWAEW